MKLGASGFFANAMSTLSSENLFGIVKNTEAKQQANLGQAAQQSLSKPAKK